MVQGTASHVGKSLLVAGLCRLFRDGGWRVAPFKAQNMALNAYVTRDGREIGWAQAVQAEAAGLPPSVEMNPILLKPHADAGSQVIIHGNVWGNLTAREYYAQRPVLWEAIRTSYDGLAREYDLILIEGAGSPAEPNLMAHDITNMAVARLARAPVLLVGDIDRGGVFAALLGTLTLLPPKDRRRIRALIINKFRGDRSLLSPGIEFLERKARRPVLGIVPHLHGLAIPEEDSVSIEEIENVNTYAIPLESRHEPRPFRVVVVRLPHIANFADFSPLEQEPGISLGYTANPDGLGQADLLILPGSKNTIGDLRFLKESGWAKRILSYHRDGGLVGGICGGLQMLGLRVEDPEGLETGGEEDGLALLPLVTRLEAPKVTRQVRATLLLGPWGAAQEFEAYEIHMGRSWPIGECSPLFEILAPESSEPVGYCSSDGRAWGSYLHGLFDSPGLRRALFSWLGANRPVGHEPLPPSLDYRALREASYNRLAETLRAHLSLDLLWNIVGER